MAPWWQRSCIIIIYCNRCPNCLDQHRNIHPQKLQRNLKTCTRQYFRKQREYRMHNNVFSNQMLCTKHKTKKVGNGQSEVDTEYRPDISTTNIKDIIRHRAHLLQEFEGVRFTFSYIIKHKNNSSCFYGNKVINTAITVYSILLNLYAHLYHFENVVSPPHSIYIICYTVLFRY
ncbi:hypothetical protein AGLY_008625 [Aphis glycines]|uniref:Uncharacterized protein n=1 Tax=Aphis glycines TaxID=307491 RepID=A0A6G0TKJ7_APHGL|nr:hypothetical protein AGLY_008625 [Aphis glycines]